MGQTGAFQLYGGPREVFQRLFVIRYYSCVGPRIGVLDAVGLVGVLCEAGFLDRLGPTHTATYQELLLRWAQLTFGGTAVGWRGLGTVMSWRTGRGVKGGVKRRGRGLRKLKELLVKP